ncbi:phosphoadenylyl-sulfate reductase [Heliorestis acidaminivorans]|uniref:Adenosine 5'-phosphosulfate reductase n=1 Tax=Heliorestis acidaminivorans TaxID=553427 RepID=A0A6I0EU61_9FIRM|nr:phosphoadenylyl-sulfate reductase [Heliorestis acidaminivorans]KAB2952710.1 phosphoadenylyl-sulfate reductase [Heliorestis acidaminivorans]
MDKDKLRYAILSPDDYKKINDQLANLDALDVIRWAYGQWDEDLVYACSFGAEAMVLIDLIYRVKPKASLLFIDTELHFAETYELIDEVKVRYPELNIEMIKPAQNREKQVKAEDEKLWEVKPDLCCKERKLAPLEKSLQQYSAWFSGLRREQSATRQHIQFVNADKRFGKVKVCPLIHWTWDEVWMYINLHNLPYNKLHDRRYPSIGCAPCTAPVAEDGDSRAGRWAGRSKTECGLHQ